MDTKLVTMALRGLTLSEPTRKEMRKTGVYCRATIQLVCQQQSRRWALRGEEAGGAVASIGHYVGFTGADGQPLPWTQRIQNFMPNGVHAVVIAPERCRVEMFRYENTYEYQFVAPSMPGQIRVPSGVGTCPERMGRPMDQFPWPKSLRLRNVSPLGIFHLFDQEHKESRCGWLAQATCGVRRAHPHQSVRGSRWHRSRTGHAG